MKERTGATLEKPEDPELLGNSPRAFGIHDAADEAVFPVLAQLVLQLSETFPVSLHRDENTDYLLHIPIHSSFFPASLDTT